MMPLISLWNSNPAAVSQLSIEQIVATAGDGSLRDGSICSDELRIYLADVPTHKLAGYVEHCLSSSFNRGGMVLQDLVNEIGRRLDYEVVNGRYQGIAGAIGFDGLWRSPEGNDLVVEVKTTDAYRIALDKIAEYRQKLAASNQLGSTSSILIVVGRQETGELEAQIRGSRHAWDVRLISVEALLKLLQVKENSNEAETGTKIRSLFSPVEYTRLDRMVDVVFTAATDAEVGPEISEPEQLHEEEQKNADSPSPVEALKPPYQFTDSALLQAHRLAIIGSLATRESTHLLQKSRAQYWNATRDVRAVCSISKRYEGKGQNPYWYAYHPQWDEFLSGAERSYFVLGCMDRSQAFAIPLDVIRSILPDLHQTVRNGGAYWHIHLVGQEGKLAVHQPLAGVSLPLAPFSFPISNHVLLGEPLR
jgi:hypothetical protein